MREKIYGFWTHIYLPDRIKMFVQCGYDRSSILLVYPKQSENTHQVVP